MRWVLAGVLVGVLAVPSSPTALAFHERGSVVVYEPGGLSDATIARVRAVAARRGSSLTVFHTGTLGLLRVERDGEAIQIAPAGFRYPMSAMAVRPEQAVHLVGAGAAAAMARGEVVMGEASARLRGAAAGDRVVFLGWDGEVHEAAIGVVVPDQEIDWAEMAFGSETAAGFGFRRPSYLVVWDDSVDPEQIRTDLERVLPEEGVGIRTARDVLDPDRVLPSALIKHRFGEFAYRPRGGDTVEIDPAWVEANIVVMELPVLGRFPCHRLMALSLEGAVSDLAASGFIHQFDPADFQRNGGCWNPRMIRGGDKGGAISRHAWGAAIDINPSRNPYGGEVAMNRRIVETFRHWGFAWGGTWVFTDGGHFEWNHVPEFLIGKPGGLGIWGAVP